MNRSVWSEVDAYFCDALVPADAALSAALADSAAAGLPHIHVAPNQGKLLHLLARMKGARRILEIGTLGGYSTIWLARALPPDGRLVTLEADARHAAVATKNIQRAGLAQMVEVHLGKANETLERMAAQRVPPFDFIFIDADKANYPAYLEWSIRLAQPGTVIVGDNVVRDGAVKDARSTDANILGVRRFIQDMAANPKLSATAVQTVGGKGYDGFSLAIVGP
jgi:predicted O-methyltransferase YrrM